MVKIVQTFHNKSYIRGYFSMTTNQTKTQIEPDSEQSSTPVPQQTAAQQSTRRFKRTAATFIGIFGGAVLICFGIAGGMLISHTLQPTATPSLTSADDGNKAVTAEESSIAAVAEKVGPSVVSIVTETETRSYLGTTSGGAAGTGIIVSKDGYVMTNNHVLQDSTNVTVVDSEGNSSDNVEVIGRDPLNDVAFLKIKSDKEFTPAALGNSSTIRTGQQVVAIGNALGQFSNTVTSGIISGTGRTVTASTSSNGNDAETLTDLIQTDASINEGNSGGPLVNMAGQVIGINTAIAQDANGVGLSIPINSTKGILAGVLQNGKVSRAYLGVNYITITPEVSRHYKLNVTRGAYVHVDGNGSPIASGSPAAQSGLQDGDIITKINDQAIGSAGSLSSIIGQYRPGDKITLTYLRDGKEQTATITLGSYAN